MSVRTREYFLKVFIKQPFETIVSQIFESGIRSPYFFIAIMIRWKYGDDYKTAIDILKQMADNINCSIKKRDIDRIIYETEKLYSWPTDKYWAFDTFVNRMLKCI